MELFELYNSAQEISNWFALPTDLSECRAVIWQRMSISLGVGCALYLLLLLLGGFAMYTMGKRAGLKNPWLGFLPFANTYFLGKLAGDANFFGQRMKRAGLYAMLAEIAYFAISLLTIVADFLLVPYYGIVEETDIMGEIQQFIGPVEANVPASLYWAYRGFSTYAFSIVSYICLLIFIVFSCVMYVAFFRKYFARNPILMTFLCALFPVRSIVLFAVRNNTPVDYNEYMRRRMEQYARNNYGYGPQNGGYNGQAGQNGNGYYGAPGQNNNGYYGAPGQGAPQDPFADFGENGQNPPASGEDHGSSGGGSSGSSGDDPFSDF